MKSEIRKTKCRNKFKWMKFQILNNTIWKIAHLNWCEAGASIGQGASADFGEHPGCQTVNSGLRFGWSKLY